jgi:hypothetical protein
VCPPILKLLRVLAKSFPAFLAKKRHFRALCQEMVFLFGMAFGAIEPLAALISSSEQNVTVDGV